MNRIVEIALAVIGALVGLILWGGVIAIAVGAGIGFAIGTMGINAVRSDSPSPSVHIDAAELKEMESAMQMGIAALWAIRPIYEAQWITDNKPILGEIFDTLVAPYCSTVTPYLQHAYAHTVDVAESGIRPDAAMAHIRRRYAPRFMRKSCETMFAIAIAAVMIQKKYGNIVESRTWFETWCHKVGIGEHGASLWAHGFDGVPEITMDEWREQRKLKAMESYHDSE